MSKPVHFAVGPEFLARDGLTETVLPWEDGLRADTGRGSFEWWYFDSHFDDGSTAVIVFATKSIISPSDPLTPNLSLTITPPEGKKLAQFAFSPPGEFVSAREQCDVRIGPSRVKWSEAGGRWVYALHAETTDLTADLTFTGLVPPWRSGAGKVFFGDPDRAGRSGAGRSGAGRSGAGRPCPYFAWLPAIPYGTVEGTLVYDGQVHQVKGTGYHDHNWGNVALPSVMDHWTWGRAHIGDYSLIYVEQIALKKYGSQRIPVFLLARGEEVLADDATYLTMQAREVVRHPGGRDYPREVDFVWACGGDRVRLALRRPQLIEAVSLLMAIPPAKRAVARLVANPYYFRFNADLELSIDLGDLHTVQRGPALYEIMMLR